MVSSTSGAFAVSVIARQTGDESWEASLEFVPTDGHASPTVTTGIETRQKGRLSLERWASGLTTVYAEGALTRALARESEPRESDLLAALEEIVEALGRRLPHVERASESIIAADARRLRESAVRRIAELRKVGHGRGQQNPRPAATT